MKKRIIAALLCAFLLGTLFTGCSSSSGSNSTGSNPTGSATPKPAAPVTLTFVSMTDAVGTSPLVTNDSASSYVLEQVYETLFKRDVATGKVVPLLADSYSNPDPNTWIIKLKQNIKFQDGSPFNAAAVKYTFDKIMDPKTASPRASLLASVDSITTPDDYTVQIHTKAPFGIMLTALAHDNLSIVNPKADGSEDINKSPVGAGTGPYMFKEWVPGDHLTMVKNPNYWGGTPKLDTVVFKVVPEMATAVSMVQNGEADFLVGVPPENLDQLKKDSNINVTQLQGNPVTYLGFNYTKKPLDNLKVRQAIAYAVNKDAYISTLNGLGYKSNGIIGPQLIGYDKSIESQGYNFDIDKAKQALKDAGFPDGFKITMTVGNTSVYMKLAPVIQANLQAIGITVTLNVLDWASYLAYCKAGKQELYLGGWSNVTGDGEELLYPQFFSKSIGASNYSYFNDPAFDELILKTRNTVDQTERMKYLNEANTTLTNNVGWVTVYDQVVTLAARKNVKGIEFQPNNEFRLVNASKE